MSGDTEAMQRKPRAGVVRKMIGSMPLLHQVAVTGMAEDDVSAPGPSS